MKKAILFILGTLVVGILTGCEHEHWEHRGGYYPAYEYGHGAHWDGNYNHDWDLHR
jgi:hypothetical protein